MVNLTTRTRGRPTNDYYLLLLGVLQAIKAQQEVVDVDAYCTTAEILNDSCPTRVDLVCDAGSDGDHGSSCDLRTDCFDCKVHHG